MNLLQALQTAKAIENIARQGTEESGVIAKALGINYLLNETTTSLDYLSKSDKAVISNIANMFLCQDDNPVSFDLSSFSMGMISKAHKLNESCNPEFNLPARLAEMKSEKEERDAKYKERLDLHNSKNSTPLSDAIKNITSEESDKLAKQISNANAYSEARLNYKIKVSFDEAKKNLMEFEKMLNSIIIPNNGLKGSDRGQIE